MQESPLGVRGWKKVEKQKQLRKRDRIEQESYKEIDLDILESFLV